MMKYGSKYIYYALAACLIWGTVYVAIKVGINHGFRPYTFAGIRFVSGGLILLAISWMKGRLHLTRQEFRECCLLGLFQTGIQNAFFFKGVELTNAGISSIFINTSPLFVILLAPLFFHGSRITLGRALGVVVGFGGVVLAAYKPGQVARDYALGIVLLMLSAFTWGSSSIWAKKIMMRGDTLTITGAQMTMGALPLLVAGLVLEGPPMAGVDEAGWLMLGYLIVFATSLPFFLWYSALAHGEVGQVSVFTFSLPILGVFSGWLFLGEALHASVVTGMLMVAFGIILVNWRD
ncbi:MAG TPA: DMT family transporter [Nitrospirota bacterium]|jgi:drug/metabolite transporter (DMT)-like permease